MKLNSTRVLVFGLGLIGAALSSKPAAAGSSAVRVVHGQVGADADLRATLMLTDAEGNHYCTATLISEQVVVTAAHCVEDGAGGFSGPESFRVARVGLDGNNPAENLAHAHELEGVYPSCGYLIGDGMGPGPFDAGGYGHGEDIAFLRLREPIPASLVEPVPILPASRRAEIQPGTAVTVTGYGIYDMASEAAGILHTGSTTVDLVNDWEIGTTRSDTGDATDSCNGDSGGPLYYTDAAGDTWLVGVTSRGRTDSPYNCGDGGIYTFASSYFGLLDKAASAIPVACSGGAGGQGGSGISGGSGGSGGQAGEDASGGVDSDDPAEIIAEIMEMTCALDCCGGSPNEAHAICAGCEASAVPASCADSSDQISASELDELRDTVCFFCDEGRLKSRACVTLCGAGDEVSSDTPTEVGAGFESSGPSGLDLEVAPEGKEVTPSAEPDDGGCAASPSPGHALPLLSALFALWFARRRRASVSGRP